MSINPAHKRPRPPEEDAATGAGALPKVGRLGANTLEVRTDLLDKNGAAIQSLFNALLEDDTIHSKTLKKLSELEKTLSPSERSACYLYQGQIVAEKLASTEERSDVYVKALKGVEIFLMGKDLPVKDRLVALEIAYLLCFQDSEKALGYAKIGRATAEELGEGGNTASQINRWTKRVAREEVLEEMNRHGKKVPAYDALFDKIEGSGGLPRTLSDFLKAHGTAKAEPSAESLPEFDVTDEYAESMKELHCSSSVYLNRYYLDLTEGLIKDSPDLVERYLSYITPDTLGLKDQILYHSMYASYYKVLTNDEELVRHSKEIISECKRLVPEELIESVQERTAVVTAYVDLMSYACARDEFATCKACYLDYIALVSETGPLTINTDQRVTISLLLGGALLKLGEINEGLTHLFSVFVAAPDANTELKRMAAVLILQNREAALKLPAADFLAYCRAAGTEEALAFVAAYELAQK